MSAKPLPPEKQQQIRDTLARLGSIQETACEHGVSRDTVRKYTSGPAAPPSDAPRVAFNMPRVIPTNKTPAGIPPAKHEQPAPADAGDDFPAAVKSVYEPFAIDAPGSWLVLNDIHVPWHDRETIELAVTEAKRRNVVGVILNGDILDSHEISAHDKDPRAPRYVEEVETGKALLKWLRKQLPHAELVYKEGNHEERLSRYVMRQAPALFGLEGTDLPALLHLKDIGCEWVGDKRVIELGKLCVLHGHEYQGAGGVNPARWLFMRARYVSLCGHFHRTSEHRDRNVRMRYEAAWSVGCACWLAPKYRPLNSWNNGCAFVEIANDGEFNVDNRAVFRGKLV